MEKVRSSFFATYLSGFKLNLAALFIGGGTTATAVFALITQASTAVPLILETLNLSGCRATDVYLGTQSDFKKEGDVWREYPAGAASYRYEFTEINRTTVKVVLRNVTPRDDTPDWRTLTVHLPSCGGDAKLSEGRPERTIVLEEVWRPRES